MFPGSGRLEWLIRKVAWQNYVTTAQKIVVFFPPVNEEANLHLYAAKVIFLKLVKLMFVTTQLYLVCQTLLISKYQHFIAILSIL